LYRAAQAHALIEGRTYAVPDDVKVLARPVLAHRILTRSARPGASDTAEAVVAEITGRVAVPV
jgi:MoxR-like ATPase